MLKKQKNNIFVLGIVAILAISLAIPTPAAALDIDGIYMTSCMDHLDGVPETDPWVFEIWFDFEDEGTLDHIEVTPPGGGSGPFTIYDGDWDYESPTDYSSLGNLQADYPTGTYTFDFLDTDDVQLNLVELDYSDISEPDSPVDFAYPSMNGQTGISINPTFSWTIDPTAGDALGMWLWDPDIDEDVYWDAPVLMDTLDWTPGSLAPDHTYDLEVSVFRVKDGLTGDGKPACPTKTVGGDEFQYCLLMEYMNEIEFRTVPEPATVALLGLGSLVLIRRRRK